MLRVQSLRVFYSSLRRYRNRGAASCSARGLAACNTLASSITNHASKPVSATDRDQN